MVNFETSCGILLFNASMMGLLVDASQAGEGNLEITISARGRNIPTKVHPQGSARFAVSFVPLEAIDHLITITFNKEAVPGKSSVNNGGNREWKNKENCVFKVRLSPLLFLRIRIGSL